MADRRCDTCGADISAKNANTKFCPPCLKARRSARTAKWKRRKHATDAEYHDRIKKENREYSRNRYETDPEVREYHRQWNEAHKDSKAGIHAPRRATDPVKRERQRCGSHPESTQAREADPATCSRPSEAPSVGTALNTLRTHLPPPDCHERENRAQVGRVRSTSARSTEKLRDSAKWLSAGGSGTRYHLDHHTVFQGRSVHPRAAACPPCKLRQTLKARLRCLAPPMIMPLGF